MKPAKAGHEYRPELISRRGELIAWGSFLLVGITWIILIFNRQQYCLAVPILAIILLLAALSISLGNWMDRNTVLCLSNHGVTFKNGLRNVNIPWHNIQEVQVLPAQWGKKVHVIADQAHFHFHLLGEVKVRSEVKGQVGFVEGESILQQIIENSNLHETNRIKTEQTKSGIYYVRE
jgi:hypothetical protein